jgi:hypothetical protein
MKNATATSAIKSPIGFVGRRAWDIAPAATNGKPVVPLNAVSYAEWVPSSILNTTAAAPMISPAVTTAFIKVVRGRDG